VHFIGSFIQVYRKKKKNLFSTNVKHFSSGLGLFLMFEVFNVVDVTQENLLFFPQIILSKQVSQAILLRKPFFNLFFFC